MDTLCVELQEYLGQWLTWTDWSHLVCVNRHWYKLTRRATLWQHYLESEFHLTKLLEAWSLLGGLTRPYQAYWLYQYLGRQSSGPQLNFPTQRQVARPWLLKDCIEVTRWEELHQVPGGPHSYFLALLLQNLKRWEPRHSYPRAYLVEDKAQTFRIYINPDRRHCGCNAPIVSFNLEPMIAKVQKAWQIHLTPPKLLKADYWYTVGIVGLICGLAIWALQK